MDLNNDLDNPASPAALATKGLYHTVIAKQYFESAALGSGYNAKQGLLNWANKLIFIEKDYLDRVDEERREQFKKQVLKGDTIFFDAISEKLLFLTDDKRSVVETFIDCLINGETIEAVPLNPSSP